MKTASLSMRLGLSVVLMGAALVVLLSALAYLSLTRQLDLIAQQNLKDKLEQLQHTLNDRVEHPDATQQLHRLQDLIGGHNNLYFSLYGPPPEQRLLFQVGGPLNQGHLMSPLIGEEAHYRSWKDERGNELLTIVRKVRLADGSQAWALLSQDRAADRALLSAYLDSALLALPLLLLLIGAGAWWVTLRGLAPLHRFRRVAALVSTQDLSHRIEQKDLPLELRELADGINVMLQRLDDGVRQLSQFSDDLAHELRSPITNLMGRAQVTLSRERDTEDYKVALESCVEELRRITRIVADMLFLAQADASGPDDFHSIDLGSEADTVLDLFSTSAEERNIRLTRSGDAQIEGERLMVQRAISNLLSNAIRHSPENSTVELRIDPRESEVVLSVTNPGTVIAPQHLPHLFERFYRIDSGRARSDGGSGLGLAIVHSTMRHHKGSARVSSDAGHTTFYLHFPRPGTVDVA
ncbi:heavy metal sensor histidine kinase [Pseudomonas sp. ABC1]|uniref:heavy metal sensor histidine kinase n=1 Tax=Pseudomonas sp. ABC1 TaxID=2748080 RepID=UPI0015C363A0|nr:heavy metal sensor histidine kinase [Pseudomonas sp. ABC1]QLF92901.1 heavy metal sensor histidine kinase [Pseudomonas sp. ABC1]